MVVLCLLFISLVIAVPPPPPPAPAGFGDTADNSELENDEVANLPIEIENSDSIQSSTTSLAERVAILENKGPSPLVLISLGLDIILFIAVVYLLFRKPNYPNYQY